MVLLVGCTTPMSALRDENKQLVRTVEELRTDRRSQERKLRDLQHQLDKLRADKVTSMMASMPPLTVEVAGPAAPPPRADAARIVAIADDGTEIVYEGDAALGKAATYDDEPITPTAAPVPRARARASSAPAPIGQYNPGDDRIEVTRRIPPAVSARTARMATREREVPAERGDNASADYRTAVELVKSGSHGDAVDGLRAFLKKYPRHDYADNAQYWLGEAFYAQKDYPHALSEFRNVIETYPRGNKVPDALLKVGYCYQALGQTEKARAVLEQVVNLYPKTEPASLASKRLETP